ncbi:hypothetical protein BC936DRAFT_147741 [Jimgerdemannia flammicorona]|uniref:Uncharacterized protein n=1 Tax=Jimgerdemannia flammicorona TaxID=994334 RepID=A0A433D4L7_9FUNG|nr:hypothetical protein BC936DRAFT_147741 [Jimgerdemannia flammicorona]
MHAIKATPRNHQPPLPSPHLSQCPGHKTLQNGATIVMQQVDLIDDEQFNLFRQLDVADALPRDDVPLLRSGDNYLGPRDLSLGELHVASQLAHLDPQPL